MKKILIIFLTILCVLSFASFSACGNGDGKTDGENGNYTISLDKTSISMEVSDEYTFTVSGNYEGEIIWESSDTDVVTVNNGKITATGVGTAVIKATAGVDGNFVKAECQVNVVSVTDLEITVNYESITLNKGQDITITAAIIANGQAVDAAYVFSTEDDGIVETENVVNGRFYVLAKEYGQAVITVSTVYLGREFEKTVVINVNEAISLSW